MDRYKWWSKKDHLAYFKAQPRGLQDKWVRLRSIGKDTISQKAQLKLEWIIFYYSVGSRNATSTARHFGISRKTLHKWLGRFSERNLHSLEELSRTPHNTRTWEITRVQESRIIKLRKSYLQYGKNKLKVLYFRKYQEDISTWKIERVIRKHKLYPKPKSKSKKSRKDIKIRIHNLTKPVSFGLWHIDAIILYWYGTRHVIFTAIEELTKIAYSRVYTTNSSKNASDFLKRLSYLVEGRITIMHQDNGSEFQASFEKACKSLGIHMVYSRVRTPKDNASLERFNRTIQEEWLEYSKVGLDNITKANYDLTDWLIKYNTIRPHQALDYATPFEYAQEHFFKVLPMWSGRQQFSLWIDLC